MEPEKRLRRVLTRRDLIIYGLAILSPTAPFPIFGIVQQVSQGHVVLSYCIAIIAVLSTAASYAAMSSLYPHAGSTYAYATRALNPSIGFLAGWMMILGYVLIPLFSLLYAALVASRIVPQTPSLAWALLFTAIVTLINVRGIDVTAAASTALAGIMAGCAALFVLLSARLAILNGAHTSIGPIEWPSLLHGASIVVVSYIGFEAISTLAEDAIDPKLDIGFATIATTVLQTLICIVIVSLASLVWPYHPGAQQTETVILEIGEAIGGTWMRGVITFVMIVAALAGALAGQTASARVLYGMGRDRVLPPSLFASIHPRFGTPARATIVMAAACAIGFVFVDLQLSIELLNFTAFIGFILVNLSLIAHQLKHERRLPPIMAALLGAATCLYLLLNLATRTKIAGCLWLIAGVIYLVLQRRPSESLRP